MTRFYFLATIAALIVAFALACGSSGGSSGGSGKAADDDDNDDASQTDDDDNDNDDNDSSTGCESPSYAQCVAIPNENDKSCSAKCNENQGMCQFLNCLYNCQVTDLAAIIVCDAEYGCTVLLDNTQCLQSCAQGLLNCLKPLSTCDDSRSLDCDDAYGTCGENCPS